MGGKDGLAGNTDVRGSFHDFLICLWELRQLKSKKNGHAKYYKLLRFLVIFVLNIPPVVF